MDNLIMILVIIIGIAAAGLFVVWFFKQTKEKQIEMLQQWLILAVVRAEKELGEGTGQLKLRYVYDKFIKEFKFLAKVISFEEFSKYVDDALEAMKHMIQNNKNVVNYINK